MQKSKRLFWLYYSTNFFFLFWLMALNLAFGSIWQCIRCSRYITSQATYLFILFYLIISFNVFFTFFLSVLIKAFFKLQFFSNDECFKLNYKIFIQFRNLRVFKNNCLHSVNVVNENAVFVYIFYCQLCKKRYAFCSLGII